MKHKKIQLTQGKFALVDAEDFEKLSKYSWCFDGRNYAVRNKWDKKNKIGKIVYMHRELFGVDIGKYVDHINGNQLDNRKENLRIVTHAENIRNQKVNPKRGRSKYKGVYWNKEKNKWQAQITFNYKCKSLGRFFKEKDAAIAYNHAAKELFGEYANLNIVEPYKT